MCLTTKMIVHLLGLELANNKYVDNFKKCLLSLIIPDQRFQYFQHNFSCDDCSKRTFSVWHEIKQSAKKLENSPQLLSLFYFLLYFNFFFFFFSTRKKTILFSFPIWQIKKVGELKQWLHKMATDRRSRSKRKSYPFSCIDQSCLIMP